MSSSFKFHSDINEVVPWQAQYTFPTQATKINKQVVKLPPKNGGTFTPGSTIRIDFPADNYLNCLNSVLQFDYFNDGLAGSAGAQARFNCGGHSLIKRLRIMYGSLVIEDIQEYATLTRIFVESGMDQSYKTSAGQILEGFDQVAGDTGVVVARTLCLNLFSGLLTCKKLIPLKWMAAQFTIEITLSSFGEAVYGNSALNSGLLTGDTYRIENVNYIAEMLEFDSMYDTAFYAGLVQGGVPLKFSSWHFFPFSVTSTSQSYQINERARSVKSAFAVIRPSVVNRAANDLHFYNSLSSTPANDNGINPGVSSPITEFQWRVGGRYYPSQPVRCNNGAPEALIELQKALNTVGDYRASPNITLQNFGPSGAIGAPQGAGINFIMACEFENVDVQPDTIAGINAEEQNDINFNFKSAGTVAGGAGAYKCDVFVNYDSLLIIRNNNVVNLVQ